MDHRAIACVGLLVARCNSSEFLELAEEVFDQMAPFVHLEVAIDRVLSIRFGWNDGDGAPAVELGAEPIVVEGFVGEQGASSDAGDQRFDADAVVLLTRQQGEARQIAERIDKRDDFGRQTTTRSRTGDFDRAAPPIRQWLRRNVTSPTATTSWSISISKSFSTGSITTA